MGLLGADPFHLVVDYYRFFVLKCVALRSIFHIADSLRSDTSFSQDQVNVSIIQLSDQIDPGTQNV